MTQRLLHDVWVPIVEKAMERHSQGEKITWELSINAFPDPSTRGRFISMVLLYIHVPGSVLGTSVVNTAMLEPHMDTDQLDEVIRQLVETTLNARSQELAAMQEQQQQAHTAGRPAPAGGPLVTP